MRYVRSGATLALVLGLVLVGAAVRPLFVYPRTVTRLAAPDGTRVEVLVTHEVTWVECATLGLVRSLYENYGLTVRLSDSTGRSQEVEVHAPLYATEADATPAATEIRDGRVLITLNDVTTAIDLKTGETVDDSPEEPTEIE